MAYTTIDKPSDYFNTLIFTGNGASSRAISGLGFQPNVCWFKHRSGTENHHFFDSVRGATLRFNTDGQPAETNSGADRRLLSFDSDGFTIGVDGAMNGDGQTYCSWNWKAGTAFSNDASATSVGSLDSAGSVNTDAGFSIINFTGSGANATVAHGLGAAPGLVIVKNRTAAENWVVYTKALGAGKSLKLNNSEAPQTTTGSWNDTAPTSSVFTVGSFTNVNQSSTGMMAYCFVEKQGYSKFGNYTGNGSTDGSYIHLGFKPAFLILKITSSTSNWRVVDNKRVGYNPQNNPLLPNAVDAETTSAIVDLYSNGFKLRTTDSALNGDGNVHTYMAFAEEPFVSSSGVPATAR